MNENETAAVETEEREPAPTQGKRKFDVDKLKKTADGRIALVNVSHEDVGGYDFDKDGKISVDERFDARNGAVIVVTPRRAKMLLDATSAGEFWPAEQGVKEFERREAKRQAEAKRKKKRSQE